MSLSKSIIKRRLEWKYRVYNKGVQLQASREGVLQVLDVFDPTQLI